MKKLQGICAAPFTPMSANGDLNLPMVQKLAALYIRNDVQGVFVAGTTGEGPTLTHIEKIALLESWAAAETQSLQVVYMVGGTSLREMQDLAVRAAAHQLDGISILCPYYFRPDGVEALVEYCVEVASAAPNLPFYYYHIPSFTGGNFSMLKFLQLASEKLPSLAGIKYTAGDLFDFQSCCNFSDGRYTMLWGTDEALLSGLVAGASGAVGSTYNYATPLYLKILEAYNVGDIKSARVHQAKAVAMVQLLVKYGGIRAGKLFMKLIEMDCGSFRTPVSPCQSSDLENLRVELDQIGFFEFCNK